MAIASAMAPCRTRFIQKYPIGEISDSDEEEAHRVNKARRPTLGNNPLNVLVGYCREHVETVVLKRLDLSG